MRDFFEDLGKRLGETAETVTSKAGDAIEIQRIKGQIRGLARGNAVDLMELGRTIYDRYKEGGEVEESEERSVMQSGTEKPQLKIMRKRSQISGELPSAQAAAGWCQRIWPTVLTAARRYRFMTLTQRKSGTMNPPLMITLTA